MTESEKIYQYNMSYSTLLNANTSHASVKVNLYITEESKMHSNSHTKTMEPFSGHKLTKIILPNNSSNFYIKSNSIKQQ